MNTYVMKGHLKASLAKKREVRNERWEFKRTSSVLSEIKSSMYFMSCDEYSRSNVSLQKRHEKFHKVPN